MGCHGNHTFSHSPNIFFLETAFVMFDVRGFNKDQPI